MAPHLSLPSVELSLQIDPNLHSFLGNGHQSQVFNQSVPDAPTVEPMMKVLDIEEAQWQNWFQVWLHQLQPHLGDSFPSVPHYELTLRFTNDAELQALNARYRHQDRTTDVLAFAALEIEFPQINPEEPLYLGDIIISMQTASMQAQQQGHSMLEELIWLACHGYLHLLGWDHPDDESLQQMWNEQIRLVSAIGYPIHHPVVDGDDFPVD